MANKPERLIVDTNVFIFFLINNSFHKLDKYLRSNEVRLLVSHELIFELVEVLSRPKFRKYFSEKEISALLNNINEHADFIEVISHVNVCRDKNDNFLLALCADGRADYLITGDQDLLILKKFKRTIILTISEYMRKTDEIPRTQSNKGRL